MPPDAEQHHITVNVSRSQFSQNIKLLKQHVSPSKLMVVMKANAYGHGLSELAKTAIDAGADAIGICSNPEAHAVRAVCKDIPLIRLRMALPTELDESVESLNIEEQVGTIEAAEYLSAKGALNDSPVRVHLKLDTGMGRGGFDFSELSAMKEVIKQPGLHIAGVMTHLANADDESFDDSLVQIQAFDHFNRELADILPDDVITHSHNSAAAMRLPNLRRDMVRLGAACYGARTSQHFENVDGIKPVMSVSSSIAQVREIKMGTRVGYGSLFTAKQHMQIATIPVGFGEGYPRALANKGVVLIKGQRCPVVGRVSLDITTIDITDLKEKPDWGEEVVLIGEQQGQSITLEELASRFDSVHTELNLLAGSMNKITYSE